MTPPTDFVATLEYDAKGQRQRIAYGNGTQTEYEYEPQTFRLSRLHTTAGATTHQDLRYTYDPVGNVTQIRDLAQPVVFTNNAAVSADQRFTYDARYRLIEAEGREHQSQGQSVADDFVPRAAPDDPTGLRAYTERYVYDLVGNLLQMQHLASGGNWTRHYEIAASGNRLLATSAPGDAPGVHSHVYAYNAHGSMTAMPHLAAVDWDHADRMRSADLGGGGTVWFLYDSAGNRVRKVRVNQTGTSTTERVYVGGYEVYRERVGGELRLERQTLHIADDSGRLCMVETKTVEDGDAVVSPANTSRYQYGNHLSSVGMELNETGQLISYEEFHPYGTSAYRAANSAVDVSASRYRYTGQERDEETGLGHHGVRYYASWQGRWTAADPIGLGDGVNRYSYVSNRPTAMVDPSGTEGYEKTWGTYIVGVNSPMGEYQTNTIETEKFAREQVDVLAEMRRTGASEEALADQAADATQLAAEAFWHRSVLDLAANDPGAWDRVLASGVSSEAARAIAGQAVQLRLAEVSWEDQKRAEGAARTLYMTRSGNFTQSGLAANRFRRELNVVTGPSVGAIAFAGGEGRESLSR